MLKTTQKHSFRHKIRSLTARMCNLDVQLAQKSRFWWSIFKYFDYLRHLKLRVLPSSRKLKTKWRSVGCPSLENIPATSMLVAEWSRVLHTWYSMSNSGASVGIHHAKHSSFYWTSVRNQTVVKVFSHRLIQHVRKDKIYHVETIFTVNHYLDSRQSHLATVLQTLQWIQTDCVVYCNASSARNSDWQAKHW